ncbi:MAG: cytochrome c biogenesis protein ResB [Deltaproteobacteria bacterium]|nr:cytochrome c biogenesis protein ResB [Deltaproteobacteria bacterium]
MAATENKKERNPFWDFFSSIRLTIALLILLAVSSVAGTLIPQQEEASRLVHTWSPGLVQFLDALQIFDVYHSVWFRIIIAALALNLIVCSLDRLPHTWKRYKAREKVDRTRIFENLPLHRTLSAAGPKEQLTGRIEVWIRRRYGKVAVKTDRQEDFVFAEKSRYAHFGVYLVHLSVLLILVGGIVGSLLGFEAFVNIPEGATIDTVFLRKKGAPKGLGFSVRCERFSVDFYPNRAPKEYRSDLTFLTNGREALKSPLLVNHPITFQGITFYQASYGTIAGDRILLRLTKKAPEKEDSRLEMRKGESLELPDKSALIELLDLRSDFMRLGPAAQIRVKPVSGEELRFWVFQNRDAIRERFPGFFARSPRFNPEAFEPYVFSLEKLESKYYTGLQVNHDPGVTFVWAGCFVMVLGFFLTFFASHKRIWVRIEDRKGTLRVSVAGHSHKNPVGMERELDRIAERLQELFPRGTSG